MDRILNSSEPSEVRLERTQDDNQTRSMGDAACFGGMVGLGETYFPAFALALGLGETAAGLVASIPLFVGGTLQLVSPLAIRICGSLRRWIVAGACLQAIAFLPLALAAWLGALSLPVLLLLASVYWAAGLSTGPAWNTWMEHIVPQRNRARFFSKRSRLQQSCTFAALMLAGLVLQWLASNDTALLGFAVIFCCAFLLRMGSATFLFRTRAEIHDVADATPKQEQALSKRSSQPVPAVAKSLLLYLVVVQVFVQLSGPFFVPYMLQQLHFSYGIYVMLISTCFLSKVMALAFWGRFAERVGPSKLLWVGGVGIVPLASMWILSTHVAWLMTIQVCSGIAWAAYELGFFLMFFETLPTSQRTRLLTYYNFANTAAMCTGALTGAALLGYFGCESKTYYLLFGMSSVGRLLCLGLLAGIVMPSRSLKSISMRILSIRPGAGSVAAPVVASAEADDPNKLISESNSV